MQYDGTAIADITTGCLLPVATSAVALVITLFVIAKLRLVLPPRAIAVVPKVLVIVVTPGVATVRLAAAPVPAAASFEVTVLVRFGFTPAVVPVTLTEKVQLPPAAITPPASEIALLPAVAVTVPPQEPIRPGVAETTTPEGSGSLKATAVSAVVALAFVIVKLSDVDPFSGMLPAPNALLIVGGATTVRLALEVFPVPPSVEVTWTELFFIPALVPVTFTENVHDDPAAGDAVKVPPERLIEPLPATAVIVPAPHEPVMVGVAATTTPEGRVSVKATPLSATFVFGFVIVKLSVLFVLSGMLVGLKLFVMLGGAATDRLADAVLPVPPFVDVTAPVVFV